MLYPYQDKQTLCVTLEDTREEAISKPVLNIIAFQPLLYVAVIAPPFSLLRRLHGARTGVR